MDHVLMTKDPFTEGCYIAGPGQCHPVVGQANGCFSRPAPTQLGRFGRTGDVHIGRLVRLPHEPPRTWHCNCTP